MSHCKATLHHLLVIDDNEAIHSDFAKIFSRDQMDADLLALDADLFGDSPAITGHSRTYHLSFASQGQQGLEILQQATEDGITFGVAFVDMRMPPGWDGVQTIEHLWQVDPDLQVVICTAFTDHSWDAIAARLGHTDKLLVLKKPFDEIEAVQLVTSLCEKRRLLDEDRRRMQDLKNVVKTCESELESAHQNAEVLIASISSILICLDGDGRVSRWNPSAEASFEISADDAIGKPFKALPVAWADPSCLDLLLNEDAIRGNVHHEIHFFDQCRQKHTLDIRLCRLIDDVHSGAVLVVGTDVTKQRFIQTQLDQAQRLESVGQLAAGVAHEINTPMQYIGDNVRYVAKTFDRISDLIDCLPALIDESVSDEQIICLRKSISADKDVRKIANALRQIPEALTDSIHGVEAVSKIVSAMKEFSHPGTVQKSRISINHVLESTIAVARNEWKYVADIDLDLDENLQPINALPSELNQAFLNIVINASHAIADRVERNEIKKGTIMIQTSEFAGGVRVVIRDNGGGIPERIRQRVFEPFFTTKDVGKGTGQGLAIAHSVIVQKHQGRLWFDVEDGVGTSFTIELPRESECVSQLEAST
ncbi:MAG: response regulator [Planctomycetales bacterium]|nr:response regulator [Planctomycetales bacterium]